jgi:hypothetical protein
MPDNGQCAPHRDGVRVLPARCRQSDLQSTLRQQPADDAAQRSGTHDDNGRPIVLDHGWRGPRLKSFKTAVVWPAIIACPLAIGQPAVVADRIADDRSNRV